MIRAQKINNKTKKLIIEIKESEEGEKRKKTMQTNDPELQKSCKRKS